jgi:mono/diheme cytochrome c family protein
MIRLPLLLSVITIAMVASCYYDNEEALYPSYNSTCDTTNVTYSGTIAPILSSNCLSCHSNANAASFGNNIRLENYADVVSRAPAIEGSIKHTGNYSPMPKNGGKLKDCSITQFDIWVKNGMPNN